MADAYETAALVVSCVLLGLYNAAFVAVPLLRTQRRVPGTFAMMLVAGPAWMARHNARDDVASATLAVQTLRNTMLVSIFVGTMSFQAALALLVPGATTRNFILATLFFASFLNFALVIRAAAHLGYVLGGVHYLRGSAPPAPPPQASACAAAESIEAVAPPALARADGDDVYLQRHANGLARMLSLHFSVGFRCVYCAVPFAFSAAGPTALLAATGAMLTFLYYADHASSDFGDFGGRGPARDVENH